MGDRTTTQAVHSLRLLPSGPDRVGEGPARRRPPTALYHLPTPPRQASHHGCSRLHDYLKPPVEFSAHLVFHDLTAAGIWVRLGAIKFACRIPEPTNRQWRSPAGAIISCLSIILQARRSCLTDAGSPALAANRHAPWPLSRSAPPLWPGCWPPPPSRPPLESRSALLAPAAPAPAEAAPAPAAVPVASPIRDRIDSAADLRIGGEKMHTALLRQFYAAHDFQPVWEGRKSQAEALLRARGPRRRPWARP